MEKVKTLNTDFVITLQKETLVFTQDDDQCNLSLDCLSEPIDIEIKLKKEKQQ